MRGNILEMLAGAMVLAVAGVILLYAYKESNRDDLKGYPLLVRFEKADGLVVGSDVKVSGIKVGRVHLLDMDPDTYEAVATIMIKEGVQFPRDTSAAIISESLLGGKYLAVTPGGDEEYLESGEEILHAQSSVILEALIGQLVFGKESAKKANAA